jgi:hypothetical protein
VARRHCQRAVAAILVQAARLVRLSGYSWNGNRIERTSPAKAFSSEVASGSREENASKQQNRASVLIPSEPKRLWEGSGRRA